MEATLRPVAELYRTTDKKIETILHHTSDKAQRHTIEGNGNSILRIYAHLSVVRHRLLNKLTGRNDEIQFEGSAGGFPSHGDKLPPRGEVDVAYRNVTKQLYDCFEQLTAQQLEGPGYGQDDFPTNDKTLLGSLIYLGYHEAYSVGQMGFLGHAQDQLPNAAHLG